MRANPLHVLISTIPCPSPPTPHPWSPHLLHGANVLPLPPVPPTGSRQPAVGEVVSGRAVLPSYAVLPSFMAVQRRVMSLRWLCGQVPPAALFALGGGTGVLRLQLKVAALCHASCALVAEHLEAHPPSALQTQPQPLLPSTVPQIVHIWAI